MLHVGATPESLPCREEEFVDVLSKVEEGVESGGGGCLCKPKAVQRLSNCQMAHSALQISQVSPERAKLPRSTPWLKN